MQLIAEGSSKLASVSHLITLNGYSNSNGRAQVPSGGGGGGAAPAAAAGGAAAPAAEEKKEEKEEEKVRTVSY